MSDRPTVRERIYANLDIARANCDIKHGLECAWPENPDRGNTVLTEETGEVALAINERDWAGLEAELYDVGQVIVKWLEALESRRESLDA